MCARRRTYFSLSRQRKVGKRKATPLAVSPALRSGATCDARTWGGAAELASFTAFTSLRQPQRVTARSAACCAAAPAPRPALLDTARGEVKSPRAIAALGLDDRVWERACPRWGLCSSDALIAGKPASTRREQNPGPSAAMARVVVSLPSGCAEERSGRGERVHRRMHTLRDLTRWRCLSGVNAVNKASSTAHPAREHRRLPAAKRRDAASGVAFFFGYFFWRDKKKVTAPPGAHPGQQRIPTPNQ